MADNLNFTIEIPCDDEGFVLLQCPGCGELFKLRPGDYESDDVLRVSCPSCGIISENYLTEDVIELAMTMAKNHALDVFHDKMKRLERKTRGKVISIRAGKAPAHDYEMPLQPSVDALAIATCQHCGRASKVSRLLEMSVFVCPLCGVSNFNER